MKYADSWQRLIGWIVDVAIMLPISLIIHKSLIGKQVVLSQLLYMIFEGLYYVSFWIIKGATPGMMLFKIRLITNNQLTLWRAISRYIGLYVSILSLGLGSLWMLWDKNKQTWQDKIAKTFVVKTD